MKITVEREDGTEEVFQHVTDYYLAVRQLQHIGVGDVLAGEYQTTSYSRTSGYLRDVAKEITQSLVEIQALLAKERENAPPRAV